MEPYIIIHSTKAPSDIPAHTKVEFRRVPHHVLPSDHLQLLRRPGNGPTDRLMSPSLHNMPDAWVRLIKSQASQFDGKVMYMLSPKDRETEKWCRYVRSNCADFLEERVRRKVCRKQKIDAMGREEAFWETNVSGHTRHIYDDDIIEDEIWPEHRDHVAHEVLYDKEAQIQEENRKNGKSWRYTASYDGESDEVENDDDDDSFLYENLPTVHIEELDNKTKQSLCHEQSNHQTCPTASTLPSASRADTVEDALAKIRVALDRLEELRDNSYKGVDPLHFLSHFVLNQPTLDRAEKERTSQAIAVNAMAPLLSWLAKSSPAPSTYNDAVEVHSKTSKDSIVDIRTTTSFVHGSPALACSPLDELQPKLHENRISEDGSEFQHAAAKSASSEKYLTWSPSSLSSSKFKSALNLRDKNLPQQRTITTMACQPTLDTTVVQHHSGLENEDTKMKMSKEKIIGVQKCFDDTDEHNAAQQFEAIFAIYDEFCENINNGIKSAFDEAELRASNETCQYTVDGYGNDLETTPISSTSIAQTEQARVPHDEEILTNNAITTQHYADLNSELKEKVDRELARVYNVEYLFANPWLLLQPSHLYHISNNCFWTLYPDTMPLPSELPLVLSSPIPLLILTAPDGSTWGLEECLPYIEEKTAAEVEDIYDQQQELSWRRYDYYDRRAMMGEDSKKEQKERKKKELMIIVAENEERERKLKRYQRSEEEAQWEVSTSLLLCLLVSFYTYF
jgi:hypothetical protein